MIRNKAHRKFELHHFPICIQEYIGIFFLNIFKSGFLLYRMENVQRMFWKCFDYVVCINQANRTILITPHVKVDLNFVCFERA